ncbi:MAG: hypothetical protein P3A28_03375 [Gemmatimonadota bacterium]|nr:hypothetical protein [Gemmatimonadota bacterium]
MTRLWAISFVTVVALGSCRDATAPVPAALDHRWALVSISNQPLPARPPGLTYTVLADTLRFGVTSSRWKPSPLALATRRVRDVSGTERVEEWWLTYDSAEPLASPFSIRLLCADGDLAACIDGSGQATVEATGLTLRFNSPAFGVLKYARVP